MAKKIYEQSLPEFLETLQGLVASSDIDARLQGALKEQLSSSRLTPARMEFFRKLHNGEYTAPVTVTLSGQYDNGMPFKQEAVLSFKLYESKGEIKAMVLPVERNMTIDQHPSARWYPDAIDTLKKYGVCGPVETRFKDKAGNPVTKVLMWDSELHHIMERDSSFLQDIAARGKAFGVDLNETQKECIRNFVPIRIPKLKGHENDYFIGDPRVGTLMIITNENLINDLRNGVNVSLLPGSQEELEVSNGKVQSEHASRGASMGGRNGFVAPPQPSDEPEVEEKATRGGRRR